MRRRKTSIFNQGNQVKDYFGRFSGIGDPDDDEFEPDGDEPGRPFHGYWHTPLYIRRDWEFEEEAAVERDKPWFEQKLEGLPLNERRKLAEIERRKERGENLDSAEQKWLGYARSYSAMRISVPAFYRTKNMKVLYRRLADEYRKHHFPEDICADILQWCTYYIAQGRMRPLLFVGTPGCGKTTMAKSIIKEMLQIACETINVASMAACQPLTGSESVYRGSDIGPLAHAQVKNENFVVGYVIDEIDKVPKDANSAVDEELLAITEKSVQDVADHFLKFKITGLDLCPIIFTANDLDKVNPILADRCKVIRMKVPDVDRVQAIMRDYADDRLQETYYQPYVNLDMKLLEKNVAELFGRRQTSLRMFQQLVDNVLQRAHTQAMWQAEDDVVCVTQEMFTKELERMAAGQGRRVGFA